MPIKVVKGFPNLMRATLPYSSDLRQGSSRVNWAQPIASDDISASVSDGLTRASIAEARTSTDSIAAQTESLTRTQPITRSTSDSPAAPTESVSRASMAEPRTATDNVAALTDSRTRSLALASRTSSDALPALSDVALRALQAEARSATDNVVAPSSTLARAVSLGGRTIADALVALSDTAARSALHFLRSRTDPVGNLPGMSGLADRTGPPAAGYGVTEIPIAVPTPKWANLQPNATDNSGFLLQDVGGQGKSLIDAAVTWAQANGGSVKVRILAGINAPAYVKSVQDPDALPLADGTAAYPIAIYDPNGNTGGTMGAHTQASYRTYVNNLLAALQSLYGGVISDVAVSGPSTVFAEPLIQQMQDNTQTSKLNAPTVAQFVCGGYTATKEDTIIRGYIDDIAAAIPVARLSFAFNQFHHLLQSSAPQLITASASTSISVGGSPWGASQFKPPTGANAGAFVTRGAGAWRPTSDPSGGSVINDTNANFTAAGAAAGDSVYYAGATYSVTGVSATQLQLGSSIPANTGIQAFHILPAGCPVGGFKLTDNATGQLTIAGGLAGLAGAYVMPMVVLLDESITYGLMAYFRSVLGNRGVIGNNSIRQNINLQPGGAAGTSLYGDIQLFGPPIYFQTAADSAINGTYTGTDNALLDTINNAIAAGADYLELPNGYSVIANSTGTTLSKDNSGAPATFTINGAPGLGTNKYGSGAGLLGVLAFPASGNSYYIDSNLGTSAHIFGQVGNLAQTALLLADQAAGLSWTLTKWDYLTPAQCDILTPQLQNTPTAGINETLIQNVRLLRALSDAVPALTETISRTSGTLSRTAADAFGAITDGITWVFSHVLRRYVSSVQGNQTVSSSSGTETVVSQQPNETETTEVDGQ